jgi:2-oxoglutarate ferredoxin oxidoreductase subunit delta
MEGIVNIDREACTGCGICVRMCPQQILVVDKKTKKCEVIDENKCDRLAGCERACPTSAIKIGGKVSLFGMIMNKMSKR